MGRGQSLRFLLILLQCSLVLLFSNVGFAHGRRVVLAIGSNHGLDGEVPLSYATRDAERFARVMMELGGAGAEDVTVLSDPTPQALMRVLTQVSGRLSDDGMIVLYYSGHGSESALHMQGGRLGLDELNQKVQAMPAHLRLVVIDACRDAVAQKGVGRVEPFAISLSLGSEHRGLVTMYSAGPGEVALESKRLHAGLFSHYLVSGLRGAADRDSDGRISMHEAYEFAYGRTLKQSAGAAGRVQHPSIRMDIQGSSPLVLTSVAPTKSLLALPAGKDVHYVIFEKGSEAAFAEAWSQPADATLVTLPAGQFLVQQRASDGYRLAEVTLPFGGSRRLSTNDFGDPSEEELTLRGGKHVVRKNRVMAAFGLMLDRAGNVGEGGTLRYSRRPSDWSWSLGISLSRQDFPVAETQVQTLSASLLAGVEHTVTWTRVETHFGIGIAGSVLGQELSSRQYLDRDIAFGGGPFCESRLFDANHGVVRL